jgi:Na+/melibiose symporter-like transporter
VRQLRPALLIGIALISGVLSWAGSRLWDSVGTLPGVPTAAPVVLGIIAALLAATAISLRNRLRAQRERVPGAKGVDPLAAARAVVLAQASTLVAALAVGVYGGMGVFFATQWDVPARKNSAITAIFAVVAALCVIAAGLFLQHVCRLPDDDEE